MNDQESPDETYVDVRKSDDYIAGVLGGTLAKLGYQRDEAS